MSDYVLLIAHTYKEKSDEKFKTKSGQIFLKKIKKYHIF